MALFTLTAPPLSPIARAALWILLSGICAVLMSVLIRIAAQDLHPFEVAFFRCLFGPVFVLLWIAKGGAAAAQLRPRRMGFYLLLGIIGLISMATCSTGSQWCRWRRRPRRLYRPAICDPGSRPRPARGRPITPFGVH